MFEGSAQHSPSAKAVLAYRPMVEVEVTEQAYRALLSLVMDSVVVPGRRTPSGVIA
jgi:hypothetical protein